MYLSWYARPMKKAKDPDLPDALRRTLDRLGRRTLAAVSRYAASRPGAMGGVEGGKIAVGRHDPRAALGSRGV
jgi:hypothetical protein